MSMVAIETSRKLVQVTEIAAEVRAHHRGDPPRIGIVSDECWCQGYGGRDSAYVVIPGSGEGVCVYGDYCPCEVGEETKKREMRLRYGIHGLRTELAMTRLWKRAAIPPHYADFTLDTFPETPQTRPILERLDGRGTDRPDFWAGSVDRWLLLWGPYGSGKTGLAIALMRLIVGMELDENRDFTALFITVPDMLGRLRQSYDPQARSGGATERELMESLNEVGLLVLDDLGAERATDWATERLFSVINHRHDWHRRTVMTSNLSPKQLAEHLGERTVWRILEMCRTGEEAEGGGATYALKLDGPNLRERRS